MFEDVKDELDNTKAVLAVYIKQWKTLAVQREHELNTIWIFAALMMILLVLVICVGEIVRGYYGS